MKSRGKGLFKEEFYSFCSMHYYGNDNCHICQTGLWRNVWKQRISSLFYKISPKLWIWWVNYGNRTS